MNNLYKVLIYIICVPLLLYVLLYQPYYFRSKMFGGETRYTVATITGTNAAKSGTYYEYEYFVDGTKYISSDMIKNYKFLKVWIGSRLYLKFSVDDPTVRRMLNCCKIENKSLNPPPEGWTLEELQKIDPDFVDNYQFFWFTATDDPDLYPLPKKDAKK